MNLPLRAPRISPSDPGYLPLREYLISVTGLAYYADKPEEFSSRITRRLTQLGVPDCRSYLDFLQRNPAREAELDNLIAELTIGETFFFRHREMFDALRDVILPAAIQRNAACRRLRIWSAGCSIGAEPYSVAILLGRELAHLVEGWEITILGTDINRTFLARAQAGEFEEWALRSLPDEIKRPCFTRMGSGWRIAPQFQRQVSFQYHNLVEHPYPSLVQNIFAFDVILCRNVMIYFSTDIIRQIVGHFHQCLVDDGWLLVGHSEPNLDLFSAYRTVSAPGAVLYQKTNSPLPAPAWSYFQPSPVTTPAAAVATMPWTPPKLDEFPQPRPAPAVNAASSALEPPAPSAGELAEIRELADRGDLERALACSETLLARNQLEPAAHFYRALVLEQMGRHAETQQALQRAVYVDRNYVLAHYYLGLTLLKVNQRAAAARSFRNVLGLLAAQGPAEQIPDADEMRVADLVKLTHMHLETLQLS